MKVAMIETGGWGGIAHYSWNLCRALAEAGVEVTLLTNVQYELATHPRHFGVERCFDPRTGYLRTAGGLLRRLASMKPDLVHVQSQISTRFDALLWPLLRYHAPVVMTAHNVRSHERAPWESWTLWRCLRTTDAIIVHTAESARVVASRLGPRSLVRVIRHGDYAFFADGIAEDRVAARRLLDLPPDAKILLAFGAIRPYKGILELIAALPRILARHPDAYLVIVGPLMVGTEGEYREAIRQAGAEAMVAFRPQYVSHDRVAAYFRSADVAVYNYHDVTDSGSLRIACTLGTPVVAISVGGFREFLTDGVTARLLPAGAPDQLADTISDVLTDPTGAAKMAAAARALSTSAWSWADSARATLELYREIGAGPRCRCPNALRPIPDETTRQS
jgi:glycosyltransferase involved in cell wall biosynthesis